MQILCSFQFQKKKKKRLRTQKRMKTYEYSYVTIVSRQIISRAVLLPIFVRSKILEF